MSADSVVGIYGTELFSPYIDELTLAAPAI